MRVNIQADPTRKRKSMQETHQHKPRRAMRTLPSQPVSQATVPNAPLRYHPPPQPTVRGVAAVVPSLPAKRPQRGSGQGIWWLVIAGVGLLLMACALVSAFGLVVYGSGMLPGVRVAGIDVGGLSQAEARAVLAAEWDALTLRDGERTWTMAPDRLGITMDAGDTAAAAHAQGRGAGNLLGALFGTAAVEPIIDINPSALTAGLQITADQVRIPAQNAGIRLESGTVVVTPPRAGRSLNLEATAERILAGDTLNDGVVDLVMVNVQPSITDSSALVAEAQRILANPLNVRVYDPVTGDIADWTLSPQAWAEGLRASAEGDRLTLTTDPATIRAFLEDRATVFDETRYLDYDEAVTQIMDAIDAETLPPTVRVYHNDRVHSVQSGETIISIAWDYGVPYPWVQQANGGIEALSVGQQITIPSPDNFLPYAVAPEKRIEVSISEQRTRVYENGALKWDWPASTGINDSPTWPGVYQIVSHVPNAYASNWDLYMPNFMGVYQPVPNSDFTNGFHGFPTRGGGQLLWANSLGTRVTYGCILLSDTNVQLLYDWAQAGVVVEITR
jgi:lipoprotein-anchoring transpeptidase ErfK/SrfK